MAASNDETRRSCGGRVEQDAVGQLLRGPVHSPIIVAAKCAEGLRPDPCVKARRRVNASRAEVIPNPRGEIAGLGRCDRLIGNSLALVVDAARGYRDGTISM